MLLCPTMSISILNFDERTVFLYTFLLSRVHFCHERMTSSDMKSFYVEKIIVMKKDIFKHDQYII